MKLLKKVKENVKIPVIGNGDVTNGNSAKKMIEQTGCDYIMIGRAAIGNPFIFKEINEYLKAGKVIKQTQEEKIKDYFEYIELSKKADYYNEQTINMLQPFFNKLWYSLAVNFVFTIVAIAAVAYHVS